MYFSGSSLDDIEGIMNHDLRIVFSWASQWLVNFNPNKSEAMLFTLRNVDNLPSLIFNNTPIQFDHHKHLGVTFSYDGKWNKHVENILQSALKVVGIMRKLKYEFSRLALNQIYIYRMLDLLLNIPLLYGMVVPNKMRIYSKNYNMKQPELFLG